MSSFDKIYRRLIKMPMFTHGWGNPDTIIRLLDSFELISQEKEMKKIINRERLNIDKNTEYKSSILIEGSFKSPLINLIPTSLEGTNQTSKFQLLVPKNWKTNYKPLCFHYSGTGDHNYARRRIFLANKLLEDGIGSLIVMNPFYSDRKPKNQRGSCLNNISDLFVMGAALILETNKLLEWCEENSYGPFALHGISMGGFMASICAQSSFRRLSLSPCLSASTASCVFVDGVMSYSIDWNTLTKQYNENSIFANVIEKRLIGTPERFRVKHLNKDSEEEITDRTIDELVKSVSPNSDDKVEYSTINTLDKISSNIGLDINKLGSAIFTPAVGWGSEVTNWLGLAGNRESKVLALDPVVKQFTTDLLDHFTHLGNYPQIKDSSLVCAVVATDDAYVPDQDVAKLNEIYPEAEIRHLPESGHVGAYLRNTFWNEDFRDAICTSLNRQVTGSPDRPFGQERMKKAKSEDRLKIDSIPFSDHYEQGKSASSTKKI